MASISNESNSAFLPKPDLEETLLMLFKRYLNAQISRDKISPSQKRYFSKDSLPVTTVSGVETDFWKECLNVAVLQARDTQPTLLLRKEPHTPSIATN